MKLLNRCDYCGKFKSWSELTTYGADDGGRPVIGVECKQCFPPKRPSAEHEGDKE